MRQLPSVSSECTALSMDLQCYDLQLPGRAGGVEHGDDGAGESNQTSLHEASSLLFWRGNEYLEKGAMGERVNASLERVCTTEGARVPRGAPCLSGLLRYPIE
jgi:hypothetical protein